MICWKAGADPEGLSWYTRRHGRIQSVYNGILEGWRRSKGFPMCALKVVADPEGLPWYVEGGDGSRGFTMLCLLEVEADPDGLP